MAIMLILCGVGMIVSAFVCIMNGGLFFGLFQAISGIFMLYAAFRLFYGG